MPRSPSARRGQPLVVLTLVLTTWVGVRGAVLAGTDDGAAPPAVTVAPIPSSISIRPDVHTDRHRHQALPAGHFAGTGPLQAGPMAEVPVMPQVPGTARAGSSVFPLVPVPQSGAGPVPAAPPPVDAAVPRIAAGHQLLYIAALAQLPMPGALMTAQPAVPDQPRPEAVGQARRWSGDAWLLLRPGGNGFNLPGAGLPGANLPAGAYGASQAGAVIRFHLAPGNRHRPALYLRATSGLKSPRGEELAAGLSLRPFAAIPVAVMAEGRATRTLTGTLIRPAAAVVSELPPVSLPYGLRGEAYAQAGYVGGRGATAFIDAQGRMERELLAAGRWRLRAGAGTWGGAQKGAKRLDIGPTATLDVPLGPINGRVAADWRFRVAGNAAPTSGPALTLSAGF